MLNEIQFGRGNFVRRGKNKKRLISGGAAVHISKKKYANKEQNTSKSFVVVVYTTLEQHNSR